MVERYVRDVEAVGSNPVTSTRKIRNRLQKGLLADFFNLSEFKVIENQWVKALKNGQKVTVDIVINYDSVFVQLHLMYRIR